MSIGELKYKLFLDLRVLNLPVDEVALYLRPYSKTYYGRYFPVYDESKGVPKLYVYPFENNQGDLMCYSTIFKTAIHEFCHHIQYTDRNFIRNKGVMHNAQFWQLYNHYVNKAVKLNIIGVDEICVGN